MLKISILVVALALPIFSGSIDDRTNFESFVTELCKDDTKVDYDKFYRLYLEFETCKENAMDMKQAGRELASFLPNNHELIENFTFSTQQKNELVALSRNYCPKLVEWIGCSEIWFPIERECFDDNALKGRNVGKEMALRFIGFFCKNESAQVMSFLDGKIIECGLKNRHELKECAGEYTFADVDSVCRLFDTVGRCLVKIFEQCEFSQTAGTLMRSLFTDLRTGTACVNLTSTNDLN